MIDHPVLQVRMIRRLLCAKTYKRLLTRCRWRIFDSGVDVRGGGKRSSRPGTSVVYRLLSDPEVPFAGVRHAHTGNVSDMVRQPALGDAAGASPTASQSHQPASHQTEDQEVAKEAAPPATSTKTQQNIRRFSPYSLIQRY
jgi:hypothetical protein